MTRVMLHIGTHKTGTTALQGFLYDNDEALAAQGYHYFKAPVKYAKATRERNGQFLLRYAKDQILPEVADPDAILATDENLIAFKRAVGTYDVIVLSEEVLWYEHALRPDTLPMIKSLLENYGVEDIQVFMYLRRQDEYISSLWNQRVKDTVKLTIPLGKYVDRQNARKVVDYAEGLKRLVDIFGRENVHVRLYNRADLANGDIRHDFCSLIGLNITEEFVWREKGANLSLSNNMAAIRMQVNRVESYRNGDNFLYGPSVRTSVIGDEDQTSMLAPKQRRAIFERYAEGNAWIAKEFFGRDDGVLFPIPDEFPEKWEPDSVSLQRDAIRFFTDALAVEHAKRVAADKRAKALAERVKALEKRSKAIDEELEAFDKRAKKLEKQVKSLESRHTEKEPEKSKASKKTDKSKVRPDDLLAAGGDFLMRVQRKLRRVVKGALQSGKSAQKRRS